MQKIQASSPQAQSADLVGANIEQLKKLFPELLTENAHGVAVNVDVLKALVGDKTATDADEKYGLNWHGKRRARQLALTPSTGTLRPCPDESVDWDTTQNLMIEGDNLEVLKLLQKSYANKVKLIYIDPPYNTGKDFVYPDNFQDNIKNYLEITGQSEGGAKVSSNTEASGRFHTDWLNMMYPRLKLARNLLRDDGLIFISLDDGEGPKLRVLLDEIFGEENFISCIVWRKKTGAGAKPKGFIPLHEYIFCYGKRFESFDLMSPLSEKTKEMYSKRDEHFDTLGPYATWPLDTTSMDTRDNLRYPINHNESEIWPKKQWLWSRARVEKAKEENKLVFNFNERENSWSVRFKGYLLDNEGDEKLGKPTTVILDVLTQEGTKDFAELFPRDVFQFPKPLKLIKSFLAINTTVSINEPEIILDFFAGSGTTGQAVFEQSIEDGRQRRFISVQLPEPLSMGIGQQDAAVAICDQLNVPRSIAEITKERLRRAATKIRAARASKTGATGQLGLEDTFQPPAPAPDLGFRVFKLDHSNIRAWNPQPADLEQAVIDYQDHLLAGRSESDILYELLLKLGLDLCVPIATRQLAGLDVHAVGGGVLLACLAPAITSADVEALAGGIIAWHQELAPAGESTCVFRDSAFEDDVAKTNLTAILAQSGLENVRSL